MHVAVREAGCFKTKWGLRQIFVYSREFSAAFISRMPVAAFLALPEVPDKKKINEKQEGLGRWKCQLGG